MPTKADGLSIGATRAEIRLSNRNYSDEDVYAWTQAVRPTKLSPLAKERVAWELHLEYNRITSRGLTYLLTLVCELGGHLQVVKAYRNRIERAPLDILFGGRRLRELHLSHNALSQSAVLEIVNYALNLRSGKEPAYPLEGRFPLWLRTEANPATAQGILDNTLTLSDSRICPIEYVEQGCTPMGCMARSTTPAVHFYMISAKGHEATAQKQATGSATAARTCPPQCKAKVVTPISSRGAATAPPRVCTVWGPKQNAAETPPKGGAFPPLPSRKTTATSAQKPPAAPCDTAAKSSGPGAQEGRAPTAAADPQSPCSHASAVSTPADFPPLPSTATQESARRPRQMHERFRPRAGFRRFEPEHEEQPEMYLAFEAKDVLTLLEGPKKMGLWDSYYLAVNEEGSQGMVPCCLLDTLPLAH